MTRLAFVWLAVALLTAAGVGRTLHLALAEHQLCEHGQYVHSHGHHGHGAAQQDGGGDLPARTRQSESVGWQAGDGVVADHDHCELCAVQAADVPSLSGAPLAAALAWLLEGPVVPVTRECRPLSALTVAPKHSPTTC